MMEKLSINRKLLPMKAHYFLFNAGKFPSKVNSDRKRANIV